MSDVAVPAETRTPEEIIAAILERSDLVPEPGERRRFNCTDFQILSTDTADLVHKISVLGTIIEELGGIPADRRELPWLIMGSDGGGP